jgi:hypothetical protein
VYLTGHKSQETLEGINNFQIYYMKTLKKQRLSVSIALLVGLAVSPMAFAQTASTGPNKVYIEQIGNTNTLTIQQVGGTNTVGGVTNTSMTTSNTNITTLVPADPSSTNYATINGSSNTLAITQTGDSNSAQYNIRGSNNSYTSTITGNGNQTNLSMGDANVNALRSTVTETVTGDNNLIMQTVIGSDITSTTTIGGNTNQVTKELKSTNGISTLSITGNNNVIDAQQVDSAGANGHSLAQVVAGNFNSITTQQQGFNDTTINTRTTGDNNTITIRTSSATITNSKTAVAR